MNGYLMFVGIYLEMEAILSILYSFDRKWSLNRTLARIFRATLGFSLIAIGFL